MSQPIQSFEEFWPYYVRQHLSPLNRALHFVGTTLAVVTAVRAIRKRRPLGLLVAPVLAWLCLLVPSLLQAFTGLPRPLIWPKNSTGVILW